MTFSLNSAQLRHDMNRFVQATGADAQQLCREEMRLLIVEIRKRTPPFRALDSGDAAFGKNEKAGEDKAAGEAAVRRDARNVAMPLTQERIRNPRMRELIAKGDDEGLQKFFDNVRDGFLSKRHLLRNEGEIQAAHLRARNRRGRVPRDLRNAAYARPFVGYFTKIEKAVGKAKAVFNAAAFRLGVRTPPYIGRHGPRGSYQEGNEQEPYVAVSGFSYIVGFQRIINQALSIRAKRFASEFARIVERNGKSRRASLAGTAFGQPTASQPPARAA